MHYTHWSHNCTFNTQQTTEYIDMLTVPFISIGAGPAGPALAGPLFDDLIKKILYAHMQAL